MKGIKVSVICVTYNHAGFIRQALDGFVMQKTDFPFEVLIHDDASTDGTADIIREYAKKYPDIIKPVFQTENQWARGLDISKEYNWPRIRGQYVAVCDGDDYWTDASKLQKQADFLDAHPDYTICFHPVSVFWDNGEQPDSIFPGKRKLKDISLDKLSKQNFIPNLSVMYRWQPNGLDVIKEWPEHIYPGDWFLHLLHAKYGKIGYLPDVMARYRRHSGGISFVSEYGLDALYTKYGIKEMNLYLAIEKQIVPDSPTYHNFVRARAREILTVYAKNQDFDSATQILKMCPDLMVDTTNNARTIRWHHNFNRLVLAIPFILIIGIIIGYML